MSISYTSVQWNRHKKTYDACIAAAAVVFVAVFVGLGRVLFPPPHDVSVEVLLIRASGTLAILMLHVILSVGPLARLDARGSALLYNRRHLGVSFFLVALTHAALTVGYYGGFGGKNPLLALIAGYSSRTVSGFSFEILGFLALLVFFVMAATSHDFWLKNLTARVWKWLHMGVYAAYALVVMHVALGAMQGEGGVVIPMLLLLGAGWLGALHVIAGVREVRRDRGGLVEDGEGWVDACAVGEIAESKAKVVCLKGRGRERVAIFRDGDTLSAVANVCAHQGGPLGEGQIIDGCITCPWHGYQYLAKNGQSPPPFTEKIPTYEVRVRGSRVQLNPRARAPGTPVEPAKIVVGRGMETGAGGGT